MNSNYQPGFPVTEEMPAVAARPPRRWFGTVVVLAAIAVAVLFGVLIYLALDNDKSATTGPTVTDDVAPTAAPSEGATPEVIDLEPQPSGLWQVVGVEGGLNVRKQPGTSGEIIGAFPAGERNVRGTGARAEVNGAPWTEVDLGAGVTGWVSSRYLAVDDGTASPTPTAIPPAGTLTSTVCFQSGGAARLRTIRLNYFDRTTIEGQIRTDTNGRIEFETATGVLRDGRAAMTIFNDDNEDTRTQTWQFGAADLALTAQESVRVVSCDLVSPLLP